MSIITLTTDWGRRDHYLASVKGNLLKLIPDITIVDITHEISTFDIYQTSFILKSCFLDFPEGSIHIIGVNSDASIEEPHTLVKYKGHFFIGADNGVFSLMFDEEPEKIIELEIIQQTDKYTFSTKDVFVHAAQFIHEGKDINELGFVKAELNKRMSFEPVIESNSDGSLTIIGKVIHLDRYENAITNINEELFLKYIKGREFSISFNSFTEAIQNISKSYSDVPVSEMLAIFNSVGLLEIAINQGNAASLLGLKIDSRIRLIIK
jgi:S-adenosylmethionine hydrolase